MWGESWLSFQGYLLDASALVELVLRGVLFTQLSGKALHMLDLTIYECFNALWKLIRRGVLTADEGLALARGVTDIISALSVNSVDPFEALNVLETVLREGLTVYDASYLYIAEKLGLILVTEDMELIDKARKLGIKAISVDEFLKRD